MNDELKKGGEIPTPRTDAFTTSLYHASCAAAADLPGYPGMDHSPEEAYSMAVDLAKELERELADAIRERDEARRHRRLLLDNDLTAQVLVALERERGEAVAYAEERGRLLKAATVILGLWSETELDPEDEEYEHFMAAFNESVTGFLAEARHALAKNPIGHSDKAEVSDKPIGAISNADKGGASGSLITEGHQTGHAQAAEWITRKVAEQGDLDEPAAGGGVLPSCLCCGEYRGDHGPNKECPVMVIDGWHSRDTFLERPRQGHSNTDADTPRLIRRLRRLLDKDIHADDAEIQDAIEDAEAHLVLLETEQPRQGPSDTTLRDLIAAYDHHQANVAEGLGAVSGGRLRAAFDAARAVLSPGNGYSSIVTAPADDGKGRKSAYDTTWPNMHGEV